MRICERVLEEEVAGEYVLREEEVDFNNMAAALLREFEPAAREQGVKLSFKVDDNFPELFTDPLLLNQALSNLVSNAIKFTARGGSVEVLGKVDVENSAVIMVVQDDGAGIAPWLMVSLMAGERVTTTDPADFAEEKGWGRGFQIVREFVDRLGATLHVDSVEGQGTIISLRLDIPTPEVQD